MKALDWMIVLLLPVWAPLALVGFVLAFPVAFVGMGFMAGWRIATEWDDGRQHSKTIH